jgi:hypothetical protein
MSAGWRFAWAQAMSRRCRAGVVGRCRLVGAVLGEPLIGDRGGRLGGGHVAGDRGQEGRPSEGEHGRSDVIVLAVRWYLRFGPSYRDLEELLAERGVEVDHVTIYRWVQRFTPYSPTPLGPAGIVWEIAGRWTRPR